MTAIRLATATPPRQLMRCSRQLFGQTSEGYYIGGQFLDGREADLAGQAGGPPLNPIEMGMPDKTSVVARLQENPDYVAAIQVYFGSRDL